VCVVLLLLLSTGFVAQTKRFTAYYDNEELATVLEAVEKTFEINISFPSEIVQHQNITETFINNDFDTVIQKLSFLSNISFHRINSHFYYLTKSHAEHIGKVIITKYLLKEIKKTNQGVYVLKQWDRVVLPGHTSPDVLQALRQLPGVVGLDDNLSNMMVRGGRTDENRLIWDQINLYHRGHLFGMISTINPSIVDKLFFYNKGTLSNFGERISAVIDMHTPDFVNNKWQAQAGVNGLFADVNLNIPIVTDKLSVQTSVRRSYEEIWQTKTLQNYEKQAFQGVDLGEGSFHFFDFNTKINYHINSNNDLFFSLIGITNTFNNSLTIVHDTINIKTTLQTDDIGGSLVWKHRWQKNIWQKSMTSYANYQFDYQQNKQKKKNIFAAYNKQNSVADGQFLTELFYQLSKKIKLSAGYQASYKNTFYAFNNIKDHIIYDLDKKNTGLWQNSLFLNYRYQKNNNNYLYLGIRANYFWPLEKILIEPRFVWHTKLSKHISMQLTGEIKNQAIYQVNEMINSNFDYGKQVWQLADTYNSPIIGATQISNGLTFHQNKWIVDVDMYYKHIKNIRSLSMGLFNINDPFIHISTKSIFGLDVFVKKEYKQWKAWTTYSFVDARSNFDGINNNQSFTATPQIKHNFLTSILYKRQKYSFSLGWYYQSGRNYTAINNGELSKQINSANLPDFHHLDFSSTYHFKLSNQKISGKLGLSLKNIYNNQQAVGVEYTGNNAIIDPVKIYYRYAVGFTPDFSIRIYFN